MEDKGSEKNHSEQDAEETSVGNEGDKAEGEQAKMADGQTKVEQLNTEVNPDIEKPNEGMASEDVKGEPLNNTGDEGKQLKQDEQNESTSVAGGEHIAEDSADAIKETIVKSKESLCNQGSAVKPQESAAEQSETPVETSEQVPASTSEQKMTSDAASSENPEIPAETSAEVKKEDPPSSVEVDGLKASDKNAAMSLTTTNGSSENNAAEEDISNSTQGENIGNAGETTSSTLADAPATTDNNAAADSTKTPTAACAAPDSAPENASLTSDKTAESVEKAPTGGNEENPVSPAMTDGGEGTDNTQVSAADASQDSDQTTESKDEAATVKEEESSVSPDTTDGTEGTDAIQASAADTPQDSAEEISAEPAAEQNADTIKEAPTENHEESPVATAGEAPAPDPQDSAEEISAEPAAEQNADTIKEAPTENHEESPVPTASEAPAPDASEIMKAAVEEKQPVKKPAPPKVLPKPKIEPPELKVDLFVKAHARFPDKLGDCPFCHRVMMVLKLKRIGGKVCPVNLNIKSREFEDFCARNGLPMKVPIIQHGEIVIADSNAIADYLDKIRPEPNLICRSKATNAAGDKVFLKFSAFIKNRVKANDEKLQQSLADELGRLDTFLASSPGAFLDGDILMHPDCVLLPKLHHVRVAAKHYKKFEIPDSFKHVHAYLAAADNHPVFKSTMPTDDAVIEGWRKHVS